MMSAVKLPFPRKLSGRYTIILVIIMEQSYTQPWGIKLQMGTKMLEFNVRN